MNKARNISSRLKDMLVKDKVSVKQGFSVLLDNDINRVLGDYFELNGKAKIDISINEEGLYSIDIKGSASGIKEFNTTLDIKRF